METTFSPSSATCLILCEAILRPHSAIAFTKLFDNFHSQMETTEATFSSRSATCLILRVAILCQLKNLTIFGFVAFVYILNDRSALSTNHQILAKLTLVKIHVHQFLLSTYFLWEGSTFDKA